MQGIAQPGLITNSTTLGIDEGLADRIMMEVTAADKGIFLLHTPSTVQAYDGENIIQQVNLPSYNMGQDVIDLKEQVIHLDKSNCATIIQKSPLTIIDNFCLADYINEPIYKVITENDQLIVITKTNKQYKYIELVLVDEGIFIKDTVAFQLEGEVSTIIKHNNDLVIIDVSDRVHLIGDQHQIINPLGEFHPRRFEATFFKTKDTGTIYFSLSQHQGIYRLEDKIEKIHNYGFITVAGQDKKSNIILALSGSLYNHQDNALFIDQQQEVWEWPELISENNRLRSISSTDFNDHVICGTFNGIFYYDIGKRSVQSFLNNTDLQSGDFGFVVRSFVEGHDGKTKVLKESGDGVFSIKEGMPELDPVLDQVVTYGSVWIKYIPVDSTYWISQYNRDNTSVLIKYNLKTKEVTKIPIPISVEKFELIGDYIWVIGHNQRDGKIIKYNRITGEVELMFDNILKDRPLKASYVSDSLHLFGCRGGIIAYNPITDTVDEDLFASTKDLSISNIVRFKDQYLIGTYGDGLYILNEQLEQERHIKLSDAQAANTPAGFEEDRFGNIWMSTFDGIHIYNHEFEAIDRITLNDGLSSPEFNRASSFKDKEGFLYFGNLNGYTRVSPDEYFSNISDDAIFIEQATYRQNDDRLIANVENDQISMTGRPSNLKLDFAKSSFDKQQRRPNLSHYDITIDPLPKSVELSNRSLLLDDIDIGNYKITAKARYPGALPFVLTKINVKRNVQSIIQTIGFTLTGVSLSSLIAFLYIQRERRKNQAALTLQQEMSDLKMKALRSQLNPHFIFNSLNSIQYFIQINEKQQARDYLTKFARLMRSSLDSSYEDRISIQNEIEQLQLYLDLEKLRHEDKWDYNLIADKDIDLETTYIPSMLIQPVVENAIIHGLGHLTNRKGKLEICFSDIDRGIKVTIEDNGVGREQAGIINQNRTNHKSRATSITKDRVDLINRYRNQKIEIKYHDKLNKAQKSLGTSAVITIKKEISE